MLEFNKMLRTHSFPLLRCFYTVSLINEKTEQFVFDLIKGSLETRVSSWNLIGSALFLNQSMLQKEEKHRKWELALSCRNNLNSCAKLTNSEFGTMLTLFWYLLLVKQASLIIKLL